MDNSELLHMLEVPESLKAKVEEAVAVLQDHQIKERTMVPAAAAGIQVPTEAWGRDCLCLADSSLAQHC